MIEKLRAALAAGRAPGGLLCPAPPVPMTLRREAVGVVCVIVLTVAIFLGSFYNSLFTGDIEALMAKGDSHLLNWSKAYLLDARLREGEFPLWDPTLLTGVPYAAHPLALAFYPPNLLRAVIVLADTPVVFASSMYALLLFQLLVGSIGTYFWARLAGISVLSSVVTALAVCFCERWIFNGVMQSPMVCAGAWTPATFVALRQAVYSAQPGKSAGWALLAGIAYGFQLLGGWPQLAIYCTIAYVAYVAMAAVDRDKVWRHGSVRDFARSAIRAVAICFLFGVAGGAIGSALILPAKELMDASARSREHIGEYEVQTLINAPPPLFFELHFSNTEPWTLERGRELFASAQASVSLASALLVLATFSLLFASHYRVFIHVVLAYLLFDLSYGQPMPLSRLTDTVAPFEMSTPWYQAMLVSIPMGILAGFALDKLLLMGRDRRLPWPYIVLLAGMGTAIGLLGRDPIIPDTRWTMVDALLPATALALLLFGRALQHWPTLVALALVVEIAFGARATAVYATEGRGEFMIPLPADTGDLSQTPDARMGRPRVICRSCNHQTWFLERSINGYDPLVLHQTIQALTTPGRKLVYFRYGSADGNLRALTLLRRSFWLAPQYVSGPMPDVDRAYPPTSIVFLESGRPEGLIELPKSEVPWGSVAVASEERELWNSAGLPRAARVFLPSVSIPTRSSALRITYSAERETELDVMMNGKGAQQYFDTGRLQIPAAEVAVAEVPLPGFESVDAAIRLEREGDERSARILRIALVEDLADEIDRIEIKAAKANSVRVVLRELPAAHALVFTETNYPGWVATLDGQRTPILKANGAYQAVVVPAGTHEVEFAFRPRLVYAGMAISVTALLLTLGAAAFLLLPPRARPSTRWIAG